MYIVLALAGWSLTACDKSFSDWAQPKVYPQEDLIEVTGFTAEATEASKNVIDLGTMESDDATVQLFDFQQGTLPEGVELSNIRLEAYPTELTAADATSVAATADGKVTKAELAKLVYTFYGKKATLRTFTANLFANAVKGVEAQLITLCSFKLTILPEMLENPYYYIYGMSGFISSKDAFKSIMTPDPENDSKFSYTTKFYGTNDLLVWNSKYWADATDNGTTNATSFDKMYCSEKSNDKSMSGNVIQDQRYYFIAPTKEYYTFTIDLEALTYKWEKLENQNPAHYGKISIIGLNGDWDHDIDMEISDNRAGKHNWYAQITVSSASTEMKFRADHDWATNWGYGSNGDWSVADDWARICTNNGGNITVTQGTYNVYFCDITGAAHFVPVE